MTRRKRARKTDKRTQLKKLTQLTLPFLGNATVKTTVKATNDTNKKMEKNQNENKTRPQPGTQTRLGAYFLPAPNPKTPGGHKGALGKSSPFVDLTNSQEKGGQEFLRRASQPKEKCSSLPIGQGTRQQSQSHFGRCPSCQRSFHVSKLQRHVNLCLDGNLEDGVGRVALGALSACDRGAASSSSRHGARGLPDINNKHGRPGATRMLSSISGGRGPMGPSRAVTKRNPSIHNSTGVAFNSKDGVGRVALGDLSARDKGAASSSSRHGARGSDVNNKYGRPGATGMRSSISGGRGLTGPPLADQRAQIISAAWETVFSVFQQAVYDYMDMDHSEMSATSEPSSHSTLAENFAATVPELLERQNMKLALEAYEKFARDYAFAVCEARTRAMRRRDEALNALRSSRDDPPDLSKPAVRDLISAAKEVAELNRILRRGPLLARDSGLLYVPDMRTPVPVTRVSPYAEFENEALKEAARSIASATTGIARWTMKQTHSIAVDVPVGGDGLLRLGLIIEDSGNKVKVVCDKQRTDLLAGHGVEQGMHIASINGETVENAKAAVRWLRQKWPSQQSVRIEFEVPWPRRADVVKKLVEVYLPDLVDLSDIVKIAVAELVMRNLDAPEVNGALTGIYGLGDELNQAWYEMTQCDKTGRDAFVASVKNLIPDADDLIPDADDRTPLIVVNVGASNCDVNVLLADTPCVVFSVDIMPRPFGPSRPENDSVFKWNGRTPFPGTVNGENVNGKADVAGGSFIFPAPREAWYILVAAILSLRASGHVIFFELTNTLGGQSLRLMEEWLRINESSGGRRALVANVSVEKVLLGSCEGLKLVCTRTANPAPNHWQTGQLPPPPRGFFGDSRLVHCGELFDADNHPKIVQDSFKFAYQTKTTETRNPVTYANLVDANQRTVYIGSTRRRAAREKEHRGGKRTGGNEHIFGECKKENCSLLTKFLVDVGKDFPYELLRALCRRMRLANGDVVHVLDEAALGLLTHLPEQHALNKLFAEEWAGRVELGNTCLSAMPNFNWLRVHDSGKRNKKALEKALAKVAQAERPIASYRWDRLVLSSRRVSNSTADMIAAAMAEYGGVDEIAKAAKSKKARGEDVKGSLAWGLAVANIATNNKAAMAEYGGVDEIAKAVKSKKARGEDVKGSLSWGLGVANNATNNKAAMDKYGSAAEIAKVAKSKKARGEDVKGSLAWGLAVANRKAAMDKYGSVDEIAREADRMEARGEDVNGVFAWARGAAKIKEWRRKKHADTYDKKQTGWMNMCCICNLNLGQLVPAGKYHNVKLVFDKAHKPLPKLVSEPDYVPTHANVAAHKKCRECLKCGYVFTQWKKAGSFSVVDRRYTCESCDNSDL